jgi:BolA protein
MIRAGCGSRSIPLTEHPATGLARNSAEQRVEALRSELTAAFDPSELQIRDDSALHAGHAGAREGGHYRISIVSQRFAGLPARERHRLVYAALGDLPKRGIHALSIDARPP